jgi:hypothetical protein
LGIEQGNHVCTERGDAGAGLLDQTVHWDSNRIG